MSTNIRIIHARDFIKVTPDGQLNFEKSKNILIEIASAFDPNVDYEIILDVRKVQSNLSITNLYYLAAELGKLRQAFSRKTAVLCLSEGFDYAGFFAICAQNRGFKVRPYISFEDAIEWLIEGSDTANVNNA
jgi:hypothetical protein